jgi:acetate---CoA ligase (ADP-forming)
MIRAQSIPPDRLRELFHPRSIALVGATDASRWSVSTFENLKNFGFPGPLYCVNPNRTLVHGQPAVKQLSDISPSQLVDLAFIMVPTPLVYAVLEEAARVGIRNAVILTSGFSEMGTRGQELEHALVDLAQQHDMLLLGPNGNGFINVVSQIVPYGLPIQLPLAKGPVGVVLQSGALASAAVTLAQARHIGLSLLVSMGNEAMISATDAIDYLIEDDETRVIAVFLESIRQPAPFGRIARKALERHKPIVALKVGRSEISARSAKAHTGALVGNDAINDAAFKQLGIVRVEALEDLLITAGVLGYTRPLLGRRMGLVTPSGGACDILADRAHEEGILLPDFAPATARGLQEVLPEFSSIHNPLDVTGYIVVDRSLQQRALQVVVADPDLDFIVYLSEPPRVEPPAPQRAAYLDQYRSLGAMIRQSQKPIVVLSNTSIDLTPFGRFISDEAGIHFVGGMQHGMTALGHALWWYQAHRQVLARLQKPPDVALPIQLSEPPAGIWPEWIARGFLQRYGIPIVPGLLASNAQEAMAAARTLGFPVALKIQASEVPHKSDVGGVMLNISGADEVRRGFETIMERVAGSVTDSAIAGVLVSPMRPAGIELLVGITRDAAWGQALVVGLGGIWTEILNDTAVRVLPVQRDEIKRMLSELRSTALLQGGRGHPPIDMEHLVDIIFRISRLAEGLRDHLDTLEINPLLLHGSHVEALDVLVTWQKVSSLC